MKMSKDEYIIQLAKLIFATVGIWMFATAMNRIVELLTLIASKIK